jgi:hypothetical protein
MVGWEKYFFIINFNKSTYNDEAGHCSTNLVLGSSSTVLQLLFSIFLFAQGWLKGWDKGNVQLGIVSLL